MIGHSVASQLLDFGTRLGAGSEARANEQLKGAVAIHNILQQHKVAYLADEVGMGKTYVALGALALFRHYDPTFRVLVIAPRENIQKKWIKELRNFVEHNVRFPDMRVKALDGRPARPRVKCDSLLDLLVESRLDPDRDFFARLTSFSLGLPFAEGGDSEAARALRDKVLRQVPGVPAAALDLRNRNEFKDNVARAVCCGLPVFDLVIVDEGHNLKHGFKPDSAHRNRVLALAFGHPSQSLPKHQFPGYGARAKRVLFLSATPIEETYAHLFNQLHVFGLSDPFEALRSPEVSDEQKKALASKILVRRVTTMHVGGEELTKNMYRREWRAGGLAEFDQPIEVVDDRQRLVVALMQKKVSELIGSRKFNRSFQIGMLASFESFMKTSGLRGTSEEAGGVFDDSAQTTDESEKQGVDVRQLNSLASDYRKHFDGQELPHPKMDAVVESLANAWRTGEKALVFVRRVDSVKELKRKLDDCYDRWLLDLLKRRAPLAVWRCIEGLLPTYQRQRGEERDSGRDSEALDGTRRNGREADSGGRDTFFAWFFRGEGPGKVISGANVQRRFISSRGTMAMFFEDNHIAHVLECDPGDVWPHLLAALGGDESVVRGALRERGRRYLSDAKRHQPADRFEAAQAAALELLIESALPCRERAEMVWRARFEVWRRHPCRREAPELAECLGTETLLTELRRRPELRARLWPEPTTGDALTRFREREVRAQLLAATARLGHAFVDLYLLIVERLGSIEAGTREVDDDDASVSGDSLIHAYLDMLDGQRTTPRTQRDWAAFDELADASEHFELILDVNEPGVRNNPLQDTATAFGRLLRQQQPVGGMYGAVNSTLVKQFRMPGYPLVLIATELVQEGEDLHTFCSSIHHYGISWTPSSMEQRIGRIDRVRSATDRRLGSMRRVPVGEDLLQVFYPYLPDTVEVLQVARVLERVNHFLRLMHEGLNTATRENNRIEVDKAMHRGPSMPAVLTQKLETAFPIRDQMLQGKKRELAVRADRHNRALERFLALTSESLPGIKVEWGHRDVPGEVSGQIEYGVRRQGFELSLFSTGDWLTLRCSSRVGVWEKARGLLVIADTLRENPAGLMLFDVKTPNSIGVAVEDRVLLAGEPHDRARASWLIERVTRIADQLELTHWDGADHEPETLREHFQEASDEA